MEKLLQVIGQRDLVVNKKKRLLFIGGPCVLEDPEMMMDTAYQLGEICAELNVPFIFKSSYDKANRSRANSYRGPGLKTGLAMLHRIKQEVNIPILSDVHHVLEVEEAAKVLDVIQIPAFLCRQTDLLQAAGKTGKIVNIKKGQFMAPQDMEGAVEKVKSAGNSRVLLTERGTTFGYNNLVVDMRSLQIMSQYAPVVYDATHSLQLPGGIQTGGQREFIPLLARAAVAAGIYGLFMEIHPQPEKARCDATTQYPLKDFQRLLRQLVEIYNLVAGF